MNQFHCNLETVMNMSYDMFLMLLNTTPIPDFDSEDNDKNSNNSSSKGPVTGTTTMMDYFNR